MREQIATWDGSQGELLDSIFANQQDIGSSLQGRTFQGFWDYLMSPQLRTELRELLQHATQIKALSKIDDLHTVTNLHQDWLPAVEQTQATVRQLSQQMRRLLDDKVFLENKRIMQLIRSVESSALASRDQPPSGIFMEIDAPSVEVALPFERPLYQPGSRVLVMDDVVTADDGDVDAGALFSGCKTAKSCTGEIWTRMASESWTSSERSTRTSPACSWTKRPCWPIARRGASSRRRRGPC